MRYCLNHIILVQGFCPLKIEITVLTFLMDSVSNCLKTIRELAEYFHKPRSLQVLSRFVEAGRREP